ncbi:MAG: PilZ domain-containing protein [Pseudomonadota bacterium]
MRDPGGQSSESCVTDRLFDQIKRMSQEQQQKLLTVLEGWQKVDQREYTRKRLGATNNSVEDSARRYTVRDLSVGGVFIETDMPLAVGREISLLFTFPHFGDPIKISGEVVRTAAEGVGVKFRTDQDNSKTLDELLRLTIL